jgi:hypothetical protein
MAAVLTAGDTTGHPQLSHAQAASIGSQAAGAGLEQKSKQRGSSGSWSQREQATHEASRATAGSSPSLRWTTAAGVALEGADQCSGHLPLSNANRNTWPHAGHVTGRCRRPAGGTGLGDPDAGQRIPSVPYTARSATGG